MSSKGGVKLLNFAYIRINSKKLLGQGSFSKVFKGTYREEQCAVKLIYTVDLTPDTIKRVAAEAETLSALKHPNIVHIYGNFFYYFLRKIIYYINYRCRRASSKRLHSFRIM